MPPAGFEPAIPAKQAATHPHFRKCGHWDRLEAINNTEYVLCVVLCESLLGRTHTHTQIKTRKKLLKPALKCHNPKSGFQIATVSYKLFSIYIQKLSSKLNL